MFVTFEGMDGAGKSTQIQRLQEFLQQQGKEVVRTREPGGPVVSEKIRELLLAPENAMEAETEALLYAASRIEHAKKVIRPAVEEGKVVICDRYYDSSVAYQVYGRGLDKAWVQKINQPALDICTPDRTYLLLLPDGEGLKRKDKGGLVLDRIEQEAPAFHQRVRGGFVAIAKAEPQRVLCLDASRKIEDLAAQIAEDILFMLEKRKV